MKWMREVVVVAAVLIVAGGARGQAGTSAQGNQQTGQAPAPSVERSQRGNGKTPSHEVLLEAKKDCADLFGDLANGNTQEAARWMADEVGYTRDDDGKAAMRDDFKSKLDAVITSPPDSPYGKLSGFDLLDEAYLPNSARYFRLIYVSYHEGRAAGVAVSVLCEAGRACGAGSGGVEREESV